MRPAVDLMRWHQQLGHLNTSTILQLAKGNACRIEIDLGSAHDADCMASVEGKQHWLPFKSGHTQATCIGELSQVSIISIISS
jgi:hypothetical protein